MIGLEHYLAVAALLFLLGAAGVFWNRTNVLVVLMCLQIMVLAATVNLAAFSAYLQEPSGEAFALFAFVTSAVEIAIGIAILFCYVRNRGTIDVEDVNVMKG